MQALQGGVDVSAGFDRVRTMVFPARLAEAPFVEPERSSLLSRITHEFC